MEKLAERIRSINIDNIIDEVLMKQGDFILDLIGSQLLKGNKADGTSIGEYSDHPLSEEYVELKRRMGLFQGGSYPSYDLFFSGEFYQSVVLYLKKDFIDVQSTDPKISLIEGNLGYKINDSNLLVLSPEHLNELQQKIKPLIQQKINAKLGV